jgi:hypothetical protein
MNKVRGDKRMAFTISLSSQEGSNGQTHNVTLRGAIPTYLQPNAQNISRDTTAFAKLDDVKS